METVLFDRSRVREHATISRVIEAVEAAFAAYERGDALMPAKTYVELDRYNGDFRAMPAYVDAGSWDAAGVKWVNVHPDNPEAHDLPTVMGIMLYSDPETALPLAVMDGTELTRQRTAAAAAVATDHLAIDGATSLGIVGAGAQSYAQVEAISAVRPIETIVVSDLDEEAIDRFIDHFGDRFDVSGGSIDEAASCDILTTLTPVRQPIISAADVGPQTHVNAIGADAEGKQELEDDLLTRAKLVIDDYEQCTHSGEINVPWAAGVIGDADLHGTIGQVVLGTSAGRTAADGVTVFDSTGLAIQDVAAAHVVYESASAGDAGTQFDFLELE